MRIRTLLAMFFSLAPVSPAVSTELPPGWRFPLASDYFNAEVIGEFANPLVAELSGDAVMDSAFLLVNAASGNGGVFVRMGGSRRLIRVSRRATGVADYVLSAFPPGKYSTLEGKLHFPHGAVLLREVEYGSGTAFWRDRGAWREASLTRGDLSPVD